MTHNCAARRERQAGNYLLHTLQVLCFTLATLVGHAQSAPSPAFEVATVKPSDTKNPRPPSVTISRDQFEATGMTLRELIKIAYDLNYGANEQIAGGPAWASSTRFDIEAKEDEPVSKQLQNLPHDQREVELRQMLRTLLADRFKLRLHHESKELPIYQLVVAKGGPKLLPAVTKPTSNDEDKTAKPREWIRFAGKGVLEANGADPPMLVTVLSMQPEVGGRLVVDKTGLRGKYDFTLKWTSDMTPGGEVDAGPSLFTAIQEELGLKLESAKAPIDMLVIDSVELPAAD